MKKTYILLIAISIFFGQSYANNNEMILRILKYAVEVGSIDVARMVIKNKKSGLSKAQKNAVLALAQKFNRKEIVKLLNVKPN